MNLRPMIDDLVRAPVTRTREIDPTLRGLFAGRVVMVTGAGGSIGTELALQLAAYCPRILLLVDQSELGLYEINRRLHEAGDPNRAAWPLLVNVQDAAQLDQLMQHWEPNFVFHAAALKHVPLLENDHNLMQAVRTNVFGSLNVVESSVRTGARVVLISTDKAVHPASVMGLTKRVAELAPTTSSCLSISAPGMVSIVRFGNVFGSSGSVVPLFQRQIAQGGPVTITHPEMTRYFMTIRQAVHLVLQAARHSDRQMHTSMLGDGMWTYVLDMGRPVKILDLAQQMIEMAGCRVEDIGIQHIGLRPGEKLEEQLHYEEEILTDIMPGISGVRRWPAVSLAAMHDLRLGVDRGEIARVKRSLLALVPTFSGVGVWK